MQIPSLEATEALSTGVSLLSEFSKDAPILPKIKYEEYKLSLQRQMHNITLD